MVHDNAKPVGNTGRKFAAFVTRFPTCSLVQIYPRTSWENGNYSIDFNKEVAHYETSRNGARESARREIRRLESEAKMPDATLAVFAFGSLTDEFIREMAAEVEKIMEKVNRNDHSK